MLHGPVADTTPYTAINARVNTNERNSHSRKNTSSRFNFKSPDLVPDRLLHNDIWKSVKGTESVPPEPKRVLLYWYQRIVTKGIFQANFLLDFSNI